MRRNCQLNDRECKLGESYLEGQMHKLWTRSNFVSRFTIYLTNARGSQLTRPTTLPRDKCNNRDSYSHIHTLTSLCMCAFRVIACALRKWSHLFPFERVNRRRWRDKAIAFPACVCGQGRRAHACERSRGELLPLRLCYFEIATRRVRARGNCIKVGDKYF